MSKSPYATSTGSRNLNPQLQTPPYLSQLEFALIPDVLKEEAYDEKSRQGRCVDHAIHLASPIARKNPATDLETSPSEEESYDEIVHPACSPRNDERDQGCPATIARC